MKIVYVFNDRRPTDPSHPVVALSEDGIVIGVAYFDDWTLPFARFAMQVDSECDAPGSDVFLIAQTRAETQRQMDDRFGADQWSAVWLDNPASDPGWVKALGLLRVEQERQIAQQRSVIDVITDTVIDWLPTAEEVETIAAPTGTVERALH